MSGKMKTTRNSSKPSKYTLPATTKCAVFILLTVFQVLFKLSHSIFIKTLLDFQKHFYKLQTPSFIATVKYAYMQNKNLTLVIK